MSTEQDWHPYHSGSEIGKVGSEGIILRDEEYRHDAGVTLERGEEIPFAITCGIYGWMVHTCFFPTRPDADKAFEEIKEDLVRIVSLIPLAESKELADQVPAVIQALENFAKRNNF